MAAVAWPSIQATKRCFLSEPTKGSFTSAPRNTAPGLWHSSFFVFLSVYLNSKFLYLPLYYHLTIILSLHMSVCLCLYLSISLSLSVSLCIYLCLSISFIFLLLYLFHIKLNVFFILTRLFSFLFHFSSKHCNKNNPFLLFRFLQTYPAHNTPIYNIAWNPYVTSIFLTCAAEWMIKIWDHNATLVLRLLLLLLLKLMLVCC